MLITENVTLPEQLVTAAAAGELVLFVGAGASMNHPANLPTFVKLAKDTAENFGQIFNADSEPDAFLGQLADQGFSVRECTKTIVGNPASAPNETHRAIMRLSSATKKIRIVSTNYDELLEKAASELSVDIGDVYHAPALPLGRDFTGLVYLHGRVSRPAQELVVTDDDFGRAYLTFGWARRFVTDLFMNKTVLFIGYSHGDTVMNYLARGLPPPNTRRYVLTHRAEDKKWNELRVTPIQYSEENYHSELVTVLDSWARRLEMRQLDHNSRIREIVTGGIPAIPTEADYLAAAIKLPVGVQAFCREARGVEWLAWVEQQPPFICLFKAGFETTHETSLLASWFSDHFVSQPTMTHAALAILVRNGPVVSEVLHTAVARAVYNMRETNPELAQVWTVITSSFLRTSEELPENVIHMLCASLPKGETSLTLLKEALTPKLQLSDQGWQGHSCRIANGIRVSIRWPVSDFHLQKLLEPLEDSSPQDLSATLQILEQSLSQSFRMLNICSALETTDTWSIQRSAIEDHPQNHAKKFEDSIIDALRDFSSKLVEIDFTTMERWLSNDHSIFRRLGLYLLAQNSAMDVTAKLDSLIHHALLKDSSSWHEVFTLLETIAPELDERLMFRLIEEIELACSCQEDSPSDARSSDRQVFDFLEWLARFNKSSEALRTNLEAIQDRHPEFEADPNSNFLFWMESGKFEKEPLPFTMDDLIETFASKGPDESLRLVTEHTYGDHFLHGPTWEDACSEVSQAIKTHHRFGIAMLQSTCQIVQPERRKTFTSAVIKAIGASDLSAGETNEVCEILLPIAKNLNFAEEISEFCLSTVHPGSQRLPASTAKTVDKLAAEVWTLHSRNAPTPTSNDWITFGLNSWPGNIAQYWIRRIQWRWEKSGEAWSGLSLIEAAMGKQLLDFERTATPGSIAMIAVNTHFVFGADPKFTHQHLFPLFDPRTYHDASNVWSCYLTHPRINEAMIKAGFWDSLTGAHNLISKPDFDPGVSNNYWKLVALTCIRFRSKEVNPFEYVKQLETPAPISHFITALSHWLNEIDEVEARHSWSDWIADLTKRRLQSALPLSEEERSAWGDFSLHLPVSIARESFQIVNSAPGPITDNSRLFNLDEEMVNQMPDNLAEHLRLRLLVSHELGFQTIFRLDELVPRLKRANISREALEELTESALEAGHTSASSWLESDDGR
ncbi:SIR2 family protein [Micrococcoides hystricis]|uniref:SIR2 family protein n=1 Tax=Micrococcoides hystricis TaxID=1572761 RepID=A0ABV6PBG1_9MICC